MKLSIYLIETLVFSLMSLMWLTTQNFALCVFSIDGCLFYSIFICLLITLLVSAFYGEEKEITKILSNVCFSVCFASFLFYIHVIDSVYSYAAVPKDKSQHLCTNVPHSFAYRRILLCHTATAPAEIFLAMSSISMAFLVLLMLCTATMNANTLLQNTLWIDITVFQISLMHCHVGLFDNLQISTAFLLFAFAVHVITFFIYVVFSMLNLKDEWVFGVLIVQICRFVANLLQGLAIFVYLYQHTGNYIVWSFLILFIFIVFFLTINLLSSFMEWKQHALAPIVVPSVPKTQSHMIFRPLGLTKKE